MIWCAIEGWNKWFTSADLGCVTGSHFGRDCLSMKSKHSGGYGTAANSWNSPTSKNGCRAELVTKRPIEQTVFQLHKDSILDQEWSLSHKRPRET